jgi:hypothetical protein
MNAIATRRALKKLGPHGGAGFVQSADIACRGEATFHTDCLIFARGVLSWLKCYVARMRDLNLEELRRGGTLESSQAGAPFDAFNRSSYVRHAQITTVWERVLAVISVGLIGFTLFNILVRAWWP